MRNRYIQIYQIGLQIYHLRYAYVVTHHLIDFNHRTSSRRDYFSLFFANQHRLVYSLYKISADDRAQTGRVTVAPTTAALLFIYRLSFIETIAYCLG